MSATHCKLTAQAFVAGSLSNVGYRQLHHSFVGNTCFAAGVPHLLRTPVIRRPRIFPSKVQTTACAEGLDGDCADDSKSEMHVYRKRGQRREYSQGDMLPFDVSTASPPPQYLGRFRLDPRTHCGDVVEHDGRHFVVKSVRMRYKYLRGKYRIIGKAIEVKSLARKSIESYLEKAFRES